MRLDSIHLSPEATLLLAVVVGVLGTARVVRLFVADEIPVMRWWRATWDKITNDGGWALLMHCPWCFAPYASAANFALAWTTHLHPIWWVVNSVLAISYVAGWIVFHDED